MYTISHSKPVTFQLQILHHNIQHVFIVRYYDSTRLQHAITLIDTCLELQQLPMEWCDHLIQTQNGYMDMEKMKLQKLYDIFQTIEIEQYMGLMNTQISIIGEDLQYIKEEEEELINIFWKQYKQQQEQHQQEEQEEQQHIIQLENNLSQPDISLHIPSTPPLDESHPVLEPEQEQQEEQEEEQQQQGEEQKHTSSSATTTSLHPPSPSTPCLPRFYCHICQRGFKRAHNLKVHSRKHTGLNPYRCPYPTCQKPFMWPSSIDVHIRAHIKKKQWLKGAAGMTSKQIIKQFATVL